MLGVLLVEGVLVAAGVEAVLLDDEDESDEALLELVSLLPDFALLLDEP